MRLNGVGALVVDLLALFQDHSLLLGLSLGDHGVLLFFGGADLGLAVCVALGVGRIDLALGVHEVCLKPCTVVAVETHDDVVAQADLIEFLMPVVHFGLAKVGHRQPFHGVGLIDGCRLNLLCPRAVDDLLAGVCSGGL